MSARTPGGEDATTRCAVERPGFWRLRDHYPARPPAKPVGARSLCYFVTTTRTGPSSPDGFSGEFAR